MRPYIICHMTMSLDGRVTGDFLGEKACERAIETYYEINRAYAADGYACGRVTMEGSFTNGWQPDTTPFSGEIIPREDFIAAPGHGFYAVSFDRQGRLGWQGSHIVDDDPGYGGAHIIEVLGENTPDERLACMRRTGVSYIFAGEDGNDIELALKKLKKYFSVEKLLLEGGSEINGAFQRMGLIDELSLVVAPVTAGEGKPLFADAAMARFELVRTKTRPDGTLWLNYKKK